jgi:hypothetical protein
MSLTRKLLLALMLSAAAAAAMPVVSTGAFAQCPDKCPSK